MRADDPAVFLLDESRPKVFVDNSAQGLFETAEPSRASGNNDPNEEQLIISHEGGRGTELLAARGGQPSAFSVSRCNRRVLWRAISWPISKSQIPTNIRSTSNKRQRLLSATAGNSWCVAVDLRR